MKYYWIHHKELAFFPIKIPSVRIKVRASKGNIQNSSLLQWTLMNIKYLVTFFLYLLSYHKPSRGAYEGDNVLGKPPVLQLLSWSFTSFKHTELTSFMTRWHAIVIVDGATSRPILDQLHRISYLHKHTNTQT